jgi:hypothetical protein
MATTARSIIDALPSNRPGPVFRRTAVIVVNMPKRVGLGLALTIPAGMLGCGGSQAPRTASTDHPTVIAPITTKVSDATVARAIETIPKRLGLRSDSLGRAEPEIVHQPRTAPHAR